jgi:hypothetical protein
MITYKFKVQRRCLLCNERYSFFGKYNLATGMTYVCKSCKKAIR